MASVYQKIHALALKAQARHQLQLKVRFHQVRVPPLFFLLEFS